MSKVFLANLPHEVGTRCLIGDGKLLKFKFNGTCLGEFPLDYNVTSLQEVDIVSVLISNTDVEIAFNTNQTFTKKTSMLGLADIARTINGMQGLVFAGQRDGQDGTATYSQYIYAFLKGSIVESLLK